MPIDQKEITYIEFTDAEKEQRTRIIADCQNARSQKDKAYIEFDDMKFETWYFKAKKAAQSYIRPKENDEDVQVVTGATREKGNTLINTLLNYNLEADVTAFNEYNREETEMGFLMTKMVKKSHTLEMSPYEIKRPLILSELVFQGNVFVRERWLEYRLPDKIKDKNNAWRKTLDKIYAQCDAMMLTGLEVFPGNIRQFFMELQPFFITRKVLSYAEAEAIFDNDDWPRWKNVPHQLRQSSELKTGTEVTYDDFQMIATDGYFVEMIEYFNKWRNEYQIMLNGIPMLDANFALKELIGICEYPFAKGDGEPISGNFFFSRGVGSKNRMDQSMIDELYKMMILKTRKSFKPPLANEGNYAVGPSVYMPGKIFAGINPDKLRPIGDNQGVTPSEFNMIQFVKQVIDGKSVDPIMQGQAPENKATARQVMMQMQRSMVNIGMLMLGVINLETRMTWLRIHDVIAHWTEPVDGGDYRTLSLSDTFQDGQKGLLMMEFTENVPTDEQVLAEEELVQLTTGQRIRKTYINPQLLRTAKYIWDVNITPTEKSTNMLKAAMFEDSIQKAAALFMPLGKQPNVDYWAERWALLNDENPERFWQQTPNQMPMMTPQMQQGRLGSPVPAMARPSVNTMVEGQ